MENERGWSSTQSAEVFDEIENAENREGEYHSPTDERTDLTERLRVDPDESFWEELLDAEEPLHRLLG
ncbi:MAG: hypothetical protein ACI81L_002268 [Verrucomicrobiales bacterium]